MSVGGGPTGSVSSSWSEVSKLTARPTSLTVVPAAFFCTSRYGLALSTLNRATPFLKYDSVMSAPSADQP